MIRINLYDYRGEIQRIQTQKNTVQAISVVLGAILLIGASWLMEQVRQDMLEGEIAQLDSQIKTLEPQVNAVKRMKAKNRRVHQIVSGIEGLRNNQLQVTQILSDLNARVPDTVWLTSIRQKTRRELEQSRVPVILLDENNNFNKKKKKKRNQEPLSEFLEIVGHALKDQAVAAYVEQLEAIPYFKMVFLFQTEKVTIEETDVRKFTIYCYMPRTTPKGSA